MHTSYICGLPELPIVQLNLHAQAMCYAYILLQEKIITVIVTGVGSNKYTIQTCMQYTWDKFKVKIW